MVTYHTLQSLYVSFWLVNTLTITAPIGSPIIDICEQWERNLSFSSADVRRAGTRDEPLRTCAWEARRSVNTKYKIQKLNGEDCKTSYVHLARVTKQKN